MKFLAIFLTLGCVGATIFAANAPADSGNDVYYQCQEKRGSAQLLHCVSYINGAFDMIAFFREAFKCPLPEHLVVGQAMDILLKMLKEQPERRSSNAALLLYNALNEQWPCK